MTRSGPGSPGRLAGLTSGAAPRGPWRPGRRACGVRGGGAWGGAAGRGGAEGRVPRRLRWRPRCPGDGGWADVDFNAAVLFVSLLAGGIWGDGALVSPAGRLAAIGGKAVGPEHGEHCPRAIGGEVQLSGLRTAVGPPERIGISSVWPTTCTSLRAISGMLRICATLARASLAWGLTSVEPTSKVRSDFRRSMPSVRRTRADRDIGRPDP